MESYKHTKTDESSLLVGMAIGAVLVVAAGILFAPQSGERTRRRIKKVATGTAKEARVLKKTAKTQLDDLHTQAKTYAKHAVDTIEETATQQLENARARAVEAKEKAQTTAEQKIEEVQTAVAETVDDVRDTVLTTAEDTANRIANAAAKAKTTSSTTRTAPKRFKGV